jgi:NADH-quinone oxidoreductase subunit D
MDFPFMPLPFGPQHPASAHFHAIMKLKGETVMELRPSPGYLHRGFEKLMEYRTPEQNAPLVDRLCIVDPFSNEMGHANVVEKVVGVEAPERGQYIRVIMAELSRILSHITWIGVLGMVLGLETATKIAWGDREKIIRINEMVTGGRIYPCYFTPGGVRRDFPEGIEKKILEALDYVEGQLKFYDDLIFSNSTFNARMEGVGVLKAEDAIALGATGPNLRASGVGFDLRKDQPYDVYKDADFKVVAASKGDAYSRAFCRRQEIEESISIIRQLLARMPSGDFRAKKSAYRKLPENGEAHFCCEAARGELCFHMITKGGNTPYRVKVRGPTFSHTLAVFPYLVRGVEMADIPAIYWSLDCVPADMDR